MCLPSGLCRRWSCICLQCWHIVSDGNSLRPDMPSLLRGNQHLHYVHGWKLDVTHHPANRLVVSNCFHRRCLRPRMLPTRADVLMGSPHLMAHARSPAAALAMSVPCSTPVVVGEPGVELRHRYVSHFPARF